MGTLAIGILFPILCLGVSFCSIAIAFSAILWSVVFICFKSWLQDLKNFCDFFQFFSQFFQDALCDTYSSCLDGVGL